MGARLSTLCRNLAQGYHLARPPTVQQLAEWLPERALRTWELDEAAGAAMH